MLSSISIGEALPDLGLVLHHAVMGMDDKAVDEDRIAHRALRIAAATRRACIVSATSWVRTISAPSMTAKRWLAIEPPSRSIGLGRDDGIDEALARGADQQRQAECFQGAELGQHLDALFGRLAEADAGVEHNLLAADAGARPRSRASARRNCSISLMISIAGSAFSRLCMTMIGARERAATPRHLRIALQAPDIVEDRWRRRRAPRPRRAPSWCRSRPGSRARPPAAARLSAARFPRPP